MWWQLVGMSANCARTPNSYTSNVENSSKISFPHLNHKSRFQLIYPIIYTSHELRGLMYNVIQIIFSEDAVQSDPAPYACR